MQFKSHIRLPHRVDSFAVEIGRPTDLSYLSAPPLAATTSLLPGIRIP